jgi:hypothetical protein
MNPDDIKQQLRDAGIPLDGSWGSTEQRRVKSPLVERQKKHLRTLEGLLVQQIEADQERVADLHVALQRVKRGGGG